MSLTYCVRVQKQHLHGWRCRHHLGDIRLYGFDDVHDDAAGCCGRVTKSSAAAKQNQTTLGFSLLPKFAVAVLVLMCYQRL